jgi:hypothetical protein
MISTALDKMGRHGVTYGLEVTVSDPGGSVVAKAACLMCQKKARELFAERGGTEHAAVTAPDIAFEYFTNVVNR